MKRFCIFLLLPVWLFSSIKAGVAKTDLTPPAGTPSAGYIERAEAGMRGAHDPLLATALYLESGGKRIVLCGVDHLGFTYEMVQEVIRRVRAVKDLQSCVIYIGSSHTHSGGGAFLNIPVLGESLAGRYDPKQVEFYVEKAALAILDAWKNRTCAKVGIGYGIASGLTRYRAQWPRDISPLTDVSLIKVVKKDGSPLAALFNFPAHLTILDGKNLLFSADFIGYARDEIQNLLGEEVFPIFFNGAQGDIAPMISDERDRFASAESFGKALAESVAGIWEGVKTSDHLEIETFKQTYTFVPQPTPTGLALPVAIAKSEINLLVLNQSHAFITIPGELSCIYDKRLKKLGREMGYEQISIFGLTNDAHGYIILPESWRYKTYESRLSFGGEWYGDETEQRALDLLKGARKTFQEEG